MKEQESNIKAIFFDLWNSLVTSSSNESIVEWFAEVTKSNLPLYYNRDKCITIREEEPQKFLEKFLSTVNDPHSLRLLLSIKNRFSPAGNSFVESFKKKVVDDCSSIRWLPGALETLQTLKDNFTIIAISNIWGYQAPYLRESLKLEKHFHHTYLSPAFGLDKVSLIKKAISDLGLKPSEALMVGDRYDHDIIPAIELGMRALKIKSDESIDPERFLSDVKRAIGPQKVIFGMKAESKLPKKCLFIVPPYYKMLQSHNNRINLGITTLVELCERSGIEAKVYHADSSKIEEYPTRYQILLNSINFYTNLKNHPVFGEVRDFIHSYKPDAIVITSGDIINAFTDTGCWPVSLRVAREARLAHPESYIIAYGPETEKSLGDFDATLTHEAEMNFIDVLKNRPRGAIKLRTVPESKLVEFNLFKKDNFVQDISPQGFDVTYWRRGCAGKCQFCRVATSCSGVEKFRPLEKVLEDIEYRHKELGLDDFYLVDPNFTSQRDKTILFCNELAKRIPGISWRAESRFDTLTEGIIPYLKKAGCNYLKLGLENALGEDHQAPGKKVSLENARQKIQLLHKHGIKCIVYLMLGGYWYTKQDYEEMYKNTVELGADGYTISIMVPYVETASGLTREEWDKWGFTGSHLDIRLVDYWKIPTDIIEKFYALELEKGREDRQKRKYIKWDECDTALRRQPLEQSK